MCGISASFDIRTLRDLMELNNSRGTFSFSTMVIDPYNEYITSLNKSCQDHRYELLKMYNNTSPSYYISHCQSPTSDSGLSYRFDRIHPAQYKNSYLYHNGILKDTSIQKIQKEFNSKTTWDTQLLLKSLVLTDLQILNELKGSFACLLINDNGIFIFRNNSSILYYDDNLNISSTNLNDEMIELEPNKVFRLDLTNRKIIEHYRFKSPDNSYAFL